MMEHGIQYLPDLFVVSWLGMTPGQIDSHVYVLRGADGLLLVDCGTPWGFPQICDHLAHWGLAIDNVRTVLLTHSHLDHAAGGYLFKERGVEILAHRAAAPAAERDWAAALAAAGPASQARVDGLLNDGDRLDRCGFAVSVFHTPGHSAGCLSYLITVSGQRCLFTGDLIMSTAEPGWPGDPGHSREQLLSSLRRLLTLDFRHLCHGHDVLLDDGGRLFREALAKAERGEW